LGRTQKADGHGHATSAGFILHDDRTRNFIAQRIGEKARKQVAGSPRWKTHRNPEHIAPLCKRLTTKGQRNSTCCSAPQKSASGWAAQFIIKNRIAHGCLLLVNQRESSSSLPLSRGADSEYPCL